MDPVETLGRALGCTSLCRARACPTPTALPNEEAGALLPGAWPLQHQSRTGAQSAGAHGGQTLASTCAQRASATSAGQAALWFVPPVLVHSLFTLRTPAVGFGFGYR